MHRSHYLTALLSSLRELPGAREALPLRGIRARCLRFFLAFPLAMIFVNTQGFFFAAYPGPGPLPATTYAFLAFAAGAAGFFACCRAENLARVSRAAALLTLAGAAPWLFLPPGGAAFWCLLLLMAGVGGCLSCGSFFFVFLLNNTERFFGSALMVLVISLIRLAGALAEISLPVKKLVALAVLLPLGACLLACRAEDCRGMGAARPEPPARVVWLAVFVLLSYFAIRISGFYAPAFGPPSSPVLLCVMGVLPALLCVAVQLAFRRSIWTLCNVFFLAALLSYALWYAGFPEAAHALAELRGIGLLTSFYLIGCVTNKFCSFRAHKRLTLLCVATVGVLYLGIDLLQLTLPGTPVAAATALVLFAAFLLLSPAFSQYLFLADWSQELRAACMTAAAAPGSGKAALESQVLTLDGTGLSPREKQVTLLLLQGLTLRQIAPELGLTASTVATYSKTIYKKLGINSRAELFIRFGGQPAPPKRQP